MYTDTHCHLTLMDSLPEEVVARARAAGVSTVVTVGVDLASSAECVQTAVSTPGVWAAVGIHPSNAIEATEHVLPMIAALAAHPKVVAIGETGLDLFRDSCPPVRQEESFREHIRIAKELDKALVIHVRESHADVLRVLEDEKAPERTVFHCFSGDAGFVEVCVANGWYMSFAGNLTFTNAPALREAAMHAPLDLVVVETDAPYLSPHPYRGKPNEPSRVALTVAELARLHGRSIEDMAEITSVNARRLFTFSHER
ncbi:MAG: TatD family hydrolase [Egibacteraceae bacterium]